MNEMEKDEDVHGVRVRVRGTGNVCNIKCKTRSLSTTFKEE